MQRIIGLLFLAGSVLYGDWWLTVFLSVVFAFFCAWPLELFALGLWVDLVYGGGTQGQFPYFSVTIGAFLLILFSVFSRNFLRIHVFPTPKKTRYFRD